MFFKNKPSSTHLIFFHVQVCSDQTSCSECLRPGAFITKCYWCPRTKNCTNSHDKYERMWRKGQCQIQDTANCPVQNNVQTNPIQNTTLLPTTSITGSQFTNLTQEIIDKNSSKHIPGMNIVQVIQVNKTLNIQLGNVDTVNCPIQNNVQTNPNKNSIRLTKPSIRRDKCKNLTKEIINNNLSKHIPSTNIVQGNQTNKTLSILLINMFSKVLYMLDSSHIILLMLATLFIINFIILFNILRGLL
ncbi:unnamed protein product [Schistosoma spindalis]|nr:unnamed protein product [Schistosoma spindale]